jgi:ribokinase
MPRGRARPPAPRRCDHRRSPDQAADEEGAKPFCTVLVAVHGTIVGVLVCTLGDLLLDVIVRTDAAAGPDSEGTAETRVGAGGQSANVAAWAVELGATARFVGKRGSDAAGAVASEELSARGVDVVGPVVDERNGVVLSLVDVNGHRTMLSDRGAAPFLRAEELEIAWFRGCEALHLSGYSLFANPIAEAGAKAAGAVQAIGGRLSVDLSSAAGIRTAGRDAFLRRLELLQPDVVFGNEAELDALGTDPPARSVVIKRGADGFTVDGQEMPAAPADVVDTTGAGDALAAGFIVGGPELAAEAAARCVAKLGTMP